MTIIYPSPIFGPIQSRRLGVSLGVNLLPADGKFCSFDCAYCECGLNEERRTKSKLPTVDEVKQGLKKQLIIMQSEGKLPDVITFAGNGEPTIHPNFLSIIKNTIELRDLYAPLAKVSVLTNAVHLNKESVVEALKLVDNNLLKLDTVNMDFIQRVNRPNVSYKVNNVIENMKKFEGACIIQTMFLKGSVDGVDVNNTDDKFVLPWIDAVKQIKPREVMIYTIDRETPINTLEKATKEELNRIGELLINENIKVQISY